MKPIPFKSRPAASLWAAPSAPPIPVSPALVSAVLVFGDVHEAREDGTVAIRLSSERLATGDLRQLLGVDEARLLDITVLWDDCEEQVTGVVDLGPLRRHAEGPTGNAYADARMRGFPRAEQRAAA
ncbi:MAG TPA: hypothetical protein VL460_05120 [Caulobacteraceae bacterium]|jgi:hypothetical protein|nr:hypothetical protein [Caulobacteraceae bacterium]